MSSPSAARSAARPPGAGRPGGSPRRLGPSGGAMPRPPPGSVRNDDDPGRGPVRGDHPEQEGRSGRQAGGECPDPGESASSRLLPAFAEQVVEADAERRRPEHVRRAGVVERQGYQARFCVPDDPPRDPARPGRLDQVESARPAGAVPPAVSTIAPLRLMSTTRTAVSAPPQASVAWVDVAGTRVEYRRSTNGRSSRSSTPDSRASANSSAEAGLDKTTRPIERAAASRCGSATPV